MGFISFRGLFLFLFCIRFSMEGPVGLEHFSRKYLGEIKSLKSGKVQAVSSIEGAKNDQLAQAMIHPLCSQDTNPGKVAPCDAENKFPVCYNASSGRIKKCDETKFEPETPLCLKAHPYHRFVVSCSDSSINVCFSPNSGVKTLEFCEASSSAICLGTGNMLQSCNSTRFKREDPRVPQLDLDGYYASCKKCYLTVEMTVDEEIDERPVIKIKSEPWDGDEDDEGDNDKDGNDDDKDGRDDDKDGDDDGKDGGDDDKDDDDKGGDDDDDKDDGDKNSDVDDKDGDDDDDKDSDDDDDKDGDDDDDKDGDDGDYDDDDESE